jgi:hypothetical protein
VLRHKTSDWNVDLVIGTPATAGNPSGAPIHRATPTTVLVAIEIKSVMTEHRKAVKNRKRDFEAHHEHVHNYNGKTIAGAVMVVNSALNFRSPLRPATTLHGTRPQVIRLVEQCVTEMRNVTESGGTSDYGMDAKCLLLIDFDNSGSGTGAFVTRPPAPQTGDPLHYDAFLQRICAEYESRFT